MLEFLGLKRLSGGKWEVRKYYGYCTAPDFLTAVKILLFY